MRLPAAGLVLALIFPISPAGALDADLEVTKLGPPTAEVGDAVQYTIRIHNGGPDTVAVRGHDVLPASLVFQGASSDCLPPDAYGEVHCTSAGVSPGEDLIWTIDLEVGAGAFPPPDQLVTSAVPFDLTPSVLITDVVRGLEASVAEDLVQPRGIARESPGVVVVAVAGDGDPALADGAVLRITGPIVEVLSSGGLLVNPTGIVVGASGDIYVTDTHGIRPDPGDTAGRVLAIDPATGAQSVVAEQGLLARPTGLDLGPASSGETVLVTDPVAGLLVEVEVAGGAQTLLAAGGFLSEPAAVVFEAPLDAVLADRAGGLVRVHLPTGGQSQIAPLAPPLHSPNDIARAADGKLWVSDTVGGVLRFAVDGVFEDALPTGAETPTGLEVVPGLVNFTYAFVDNGSDPDLRNNDAIAWTEIEPEPLEDVVIAVLETITVSDVTSALGAVRVALEETVTVADAVGVVPSAVVELQETITVSDVVTALGAVRIALQETVTLADSVGVVPAALVELQETVTVSDVVAALGAVQVALEETVTVTDAPGVVPAALVDLQETITVFDMVAALGAVQIALQETITVTDLPGVQLAAVDPPRVVRLHTVAASDDGQLDPGETTPVAITQVYVVFDEPVDDPPGDDEPDDVSNPANYLLLAPGEDAVFSTVDCAAGPHPDDLALPVGPVTFLAGITTAAVVLNAGAPLPAGDYRLHVCGSTSIVDADGNALDGNGDGLEGDDFVLDFAVSTSDLLADPNFDTDAVASLETWVVETPEGAAIEPDVEDADGAPTSGSARAVNLGAAGDLMLAQCVPVVSDEPHWFGATLRQLSGSGSWPRSWIRVEHYGGSECEGPPLDGIEIPLADGEVALWERLGQTLRPPEQAASALVIFGSSAAEGEPFETWWDDTFAGVAPPEIFEDGFESGDTSSWSPAPRRVERTAPRN